MLFRSMIERLSSDQEFGVGEIGPASIIVECDVDAVAIRTKGLNQEVRRADAVTRITALCRNRDLVVIWFRVAGGEQNLAARYRDTLLDQTGCRLPQPVADLIVKGDIFLGTGDTLRALKRSSATLAER